MPYPTKGLGGQQPPTQTGTPGGGGSKWGWAKALVPIVGSILGGVLDKQSQDATNKANAQNVDKQIEFQREQAGTAYQRAVADLRAAGLNPALAYKQGGADSGSGAAAEYRGLSHSQRLQQAVDAYNQFANGTAQRQLIREQANLTQAQASKTALEGHILGPEANLATTPGYTEQLKRTRLAKGRADEFLAGRTEEQYGITTANQRQTTTTARAQARLMETQATLNEQEFQNAWYRKHIAPYVNSTAKTMEGISGITRTGKGLGFSPITRYY